MDADKNNTVPSVISKKVQTSEQLNQYVAALSATMGAFALGTALAWTSPTATQLQEGEAGFPVSSSALSWVGSLLPLGAAAAVLPVGWSIDRIGRKPTMLFLAPPFVLGWALVAWANSIEMMFVGRFITGAAGGAFSLTAPIYIAEIAEPSIRGALGSFFQLMIVIGILFCYVVGTFVSIFWLSLICMLVPLVFGTIFVFMPETPVYRLQKSQRDLAEKSLQFFRGLRYDVHSELREMERTVESSEREKTTFKAAFRNRAAKKGLLIIFGLMAVLQLCGGSVIMFYTSVVFQTAGTSVDPNTSAIIVGVIQVIANFASMLIVDRLGRKLLLLLSSSVMVLCTSVLGTYFYLKAETEIDISNLNLLPLISTCIFVSAFCFGVGPIPWIIIGEIFPPHIKGFASSLSCAWSWLLMFTVIKVYSDIELAFGTYTNFWIFTVISALGCVFVIFVVPETKGKSLEEIQKELIG